MNNLKKAEWAYYFAVAVGCLLSINFALRRLTLLYQVEYTEGNVLDAAVRIIHGGTPYPPYGHLPYVANPYGPVPYYAVAGLLKHFGVSFTEPRLLVLFAGILVSVLVALLLRHWTRSWSTSLSFGFLYLTLPLVRGWLFILRVDLIGIALALAGLCVFVYNPKRWFLSVPFFLAAVFCKFTLVAAPGACFLDLLFRKEWKRAAHFAESNLLVGTLIFAWMQHVTQSWFAFHMFWTHPRYSILHIIPLVRPALQIHSLLVVMAVVFVVREFSRREFSLPAAYFVLASLAALSAGEAGAVENQLLEWMAALSLCAGASYNWIRTEANSTVLTGLVMATLAFSVLVSSPKLEKVPADLSGCQDAYTYVKNYPSKRILSGNVGALILAGKPVFVANPVEYGWLTGLSGWPDDDLIRLIRSRYFDLILLDHDVDYLKKRPVPASRWPGSFVRAVDENYKFARRFSCIDASAALEPIASPPRIIAWQNEYESALQAERVQAGSVRNPLRKRSGQQP